MIATGTVKRAFLGVAHPAELDPDLAKQLGVSHSQGVADFGVPPNTPAAAAGIKPGDVVVEFAGKAVSNPQELTAGRRSNARRQEGTAYRHPRRKAD